MENPRQIDDLARPRLPWPIRAFNTVSGPLARSRVRFDADELLARASDRERLTDFGTDDFREPLDVLTRALAHEARLSPMGRFMARELVLQLLATRLRVEAILARHPEILDETIEAPIFIVGLPRSGTTHLHNLLSQDPTLRSLPYWESLEPVPKNLERPSPVDADSRIRRCEQALRFQQYVIPLFRLMHEMTPEARHEEIQLMAATFSTMLFETIYQIPSYRDWYKATDQSSAYAYLARVLRVLQWLRGPKRWVLKSPQHLEQTGPLLRVFPDARVVMTHRDGVRVTASLCMMVGYSHRMQNTGLEPHAFGRYWAARIEDLLRGAVDAAERVPADQLMHVRFDDFMGDDVATVERVLAFASHPLTAQSRTAIARYQDANPRGKHGTVRYDLATFGLDAAERRRALSFYNERFALADF